MFTSAAARIHACTQWLTPSLDRMGVLLMRDIVFELCAESIAACLAAKAGGAKRIELCSALVVDGLTPSHALIEQAVVRSGLPVHVLLRPRAGDFLYSDDEFELMRHDLLHARDMGALGFVAGILNSDNRVDVERTRDLTTLAAPLPVTFHRAFDRTPSMEEALEDVIASGCSRVLTSGGRSTVYAGMDALRQLVQQAAGRIEIAVGGGLRVQGAKDLAAKTGATHFHGSMRHEIPGLTTQPGAILAPEEGRPFDQRTLDHLSPDERLQDQRSAEDAARNTPLRREVDPTSPREVDPEDVREIVRALST